MTTREQLEQIREWGWLAQPGDEKVLHLSVVPKAREVQAIADEISSRREDVYILLVLRGPAAVDGVNDLPPAVFAYCYGCRPGKTAGVEVMSM